MARARPSSRAAASEAARPALRRTSSGASAGSGAVKEGYAWAGTSATRYGALACGSSRASTWTRTAATRRPSSSFVDVVMIARGAPGYTPQYSSQERAWALLRALNVRANSAKDKRDWETLMTKARPHVNEYALALATGPPVDHGSCTRSSSSHSSGRGVGPAGRVRDGLVWRPGGRGRRGRVSGRGGLEPAGPLGGTCAPRVLLSALMREAPPRAPKRAARQDIDMMSCNM